MRVGILGLLHEANTFNPQPADMEVFRSQGIRLGPDVRKHYADAHHELGGFFQGLDEAGVEAVPLFAGRTIPTGIIPAATLDELLALMFDQLTGAGKLDGVLAAPHGAAVSENHPDMDGYWLSLLRLRAGPDVPIICTIDPHANLTQRMVDACNAAIAYRTNPHVDQRQTGLQAARLMARTLRKEIRPTQAAAFPPIAINIERQHTPTPPCRPLYDLADRQLQEPGVLANSVVLGFPYADVLEMGSSFIAVTDNNPALARRLADELAHYLWRHRRDFAGQFIDVPAAVRAALAAPGPVLLLDMGDNIGGGAPGDATLIAHELLKHPAVKSFVSLHDPDAQRRARAGGVGATLRLAVGGKADPLQGPPLDADFTVASLHDGKFTESQPRHGGWTHFDLGPTAIVRTSGLTVQITTNRLMPVSLNQLTAFGLDPHSFQAIVAKGVQAPVAAYESVCPTRIRVNTPGVTCADMTRLKFRRRRKPLFPFESRHAGDRYTRHDLLRAYGRELATATDAENERRAALTRLFDYYLHAASVATNTLYPADHPRPIPPRPDAPHQETPQPGSPVPPLTTPAAAQAWLDAERASLVAVSAHAARRGWPGHASRLAVTLHRYLDTGGYVSEAITVHNAGRRAARRVGDRGAIAEALNSLGHADLRQGHHQQAIGRFQKAHAHSRAIGDKSGEASALGNLGVVSMRQGAYQQAARHFELAAGLLRQTGDRAGQARALGHLGMLAMHQGRYQQAADYQRQALIIFRAIGDRSGEAHGLSTLGTISGRQGGYDSAAEHFRQALSLFRAAGDRSGQAHALTDLGDVDLRRGHFDSAARHHLRSLTLFHETGDPAGQAKALNGLGSALLSAGRVADAHARHTAALALARKLDDSYEQARALGGLGDAEHALGDPGEARRHWRQALTLYTRLRTPEADQIRSQLAKMADLPAKSRP